MKRRGMGFGFHGSSPPWPYIGRGRGGLPRCGYFLGGAGAPGVPASPEQELDFLKNQADTLKDQLEQIEARVQELEKKEE
jgi:hypothetical protein